MEYVACAVRELPPEQRVKAAKAAIDVNPANMPARPPSLAAMAPLGPEHLAALTGKLWSPQGVNLTVSFLDNPDQATRSKILAHMNAWNKTANVVFRETSQGGHVRIARARQGYWSYLGTDILGIPPGQATMNLQGFTASGTPDSEFYRVVRHETGHTLGFPHEHTRREVVGRIDPRAAEAYFLKYDGWDAQMVRQQVLTITPDEVITALPTDVRSIMAYGLPAEIMRDGIAVPGGTDIDEEDYALAAKLYPKGSGGGGGPPTRVFFGLNFSRTVPRGQMVDFKAPVEIPGGSYDVVSSRGADALVQAWAPDDRPVEVR